MVKKNNVKVGAILPIYHDPHEELKFRGMAELLEKIDSEDLSYFIKEEKNKINKDSLDIGSKVYYKVNGIIGKYTISEINSANCVLCSLNTSSVLYIPQPCKGLILSIDNGTEIIHNDINYIVISDNENFTEVVTQKDFAENNIHLVMVLKKPFSYTVEKYSPHHYINKCEKWKVRMLANPFMSQIKVGEKLYYKDLGLFEVLGKESFGVILEHKNNKEAIIADTKDLYSMESYSLTTIAKISYQFKCGSRYYEKVTRIKEKITDNNLTENW